MVHNQGLTLDELNLKTVLLIFYFVLIIQFVLYVVLNATNHLNGLYKLIENMDLQFVFYFLPLASFIV